MLHIVNGDSVGDKLKRGVVPGDVLVWRDIYSEGPVFSDMADSINRSARAEALEKSMGIPREEYIRGCEEQEAALADFRKLEEIVLWFEHDLFDQAMLCYLLRLFAAQPLKRDDGQTKLSLLCIGEYPGIPSFRGLSQLTGAQLGALLPERRPVSPEQLALGAELWEAYAAPDPLPIIRLLQGDTSPLPFAGGAFLAHLSRLPSVYNGLGIVEQTALELAADGERSPYELFRLSGDKLNLLGLGDLPFWHTLSQLSQGPNPLLAASGLPPGGFPTYRETPPAFDDCRLAITELGRAVLEGRADRVRDSGIDERYGGVRVCGRGPVWRWDATSGKAVKQ